MRWTRSPRGIAAARATRGTCCSSPAARASATTTSARARWRRSASRSTSARSISAPASRSSSPRAGGSAAFVIPGNPVSHFVTFHIAIRRALECLEGAPPSWPLVRGSAGRRSAREAGCARNVLASARRRQRRRAPRASARVAELRRPARAHRRECAAPHRAWIAGGEGGRVCGCPAAFRNPNGE